MVIALSIGIRSAFAALPPPSAKFNFTVNSNSFEKGDWKLYFVPISNYGFDNVEDAKDYFYDLEEEYIKVKKECGLSNNFEYTSKLESKNSECDSYFKYVADPVTDNPMISFHKFHYVYLANNKPNKNTIHNYPIDCEIIDKNCEINVTKKYDSKSPYFVVLEKLNSNNDIYFEKEQKSKLIKQMSFKINSTIQI